MAEADNELLERLRVLRGIGREFTDYRGRPCVLSTGSLRGLLAALGHAVDDPVQLQQEADTLEERDWTRVLGPVTVVQDDDRVPFTVLAPLLPVIRWRIATEEGDILRGEVTPTELPVLAERGIRALWYVRLALKLPDLPTGYHDLWLEKDDGSMLGHTRLVVAPQRCYEPPVVSAGGRVWGPAVQLYALRSRRNWGCGDFTDLAGLAVAAAELGADVIGLNPLHALFPADPEAFSPYSPSSRYWRNVIYIDPEAIPEYAAGTEARRLVGTPAFQARLAALRAKRLVDYRGVTNCKLEVLRKVYAEFTELAAPERRTEFAQFIKKHGDVLDKYALFCAIQEHFTALGTVGGWPAWPVAYHDPAGPAAHAFRAAQPATVEFHCWLQWVAATQLEAAGQQARAAGLRLGFYHDLAVGPDAGGAETWTAQGLYATGATIGAPPDSLALQGQDWGIPPFDPEALRERAYEPFVKLLRANMGWHGALRIDHVMILLRLWWVPRGSVSAAGGYVHYRLDELMAIVALESQRRCCLVIGEDLGTVPEEVRAAMRRHGLYSYRVLLFERAADGRFLRPAEYPREALVTVSTHDLPPLASYWSGSDITLRERLEFYPEADQADAARAHRREARHRLLEALAEAGLAPAEHPTATAPAEAIQRYLALTPAAVLMLQPEDWLGMTTPINVPGTHKQYPNWRRKLSADWPELMARPELRQLTAAVGKARKTTPKPGTQRNK